MSASRHAARLTADEPAYTIHGACTLGLSVQVIAYRSTPETYITLDNSQHQYRIRSVITGCCHGQTTESWTVHWLSCCSCFRHSKPSSYSLSIACGHDREVELARGLLRMLGPYALKVAGVVQGRAQEQRLP